MRLWSPVGWSTLLARAYDSRYWAYNKPGGWCGEICDPRYTSVTQLPVMKFRHISSDAAKEKMSLASAVAASGECSTIVQPVFTLAEAAALPVVPTLFWRLSLVIGIAEVLLGWACKRKQKANFVVIAAAAVATVIDVMHNSKHVRWFQLRCRCCSIR